VRDKIPGERYVKKGTLMEGQEPFVIPASFPVQIAEKFGPHYYIIYPYTVSGFEYEGKTFVSHPFVSASDYKPSPWSEGAMLLTHAGELRTKWAPSIDYDVDGETWEVRWSNGVLKKIRPRIGKKGEPLPNLYSQVGSDLVLDRVRAMGVKYSVSEKNTGHFVRHFTIAPGCVVIDAGFRADKIYEDLKLKPIVTIMKDTPRNLEMRINQFVKPDAPFIISSKLLLMSREDYSLFLVQEGKKKWDLPGGKANIGESPLVALEREYKEEIGGELPPLIKYIGVEDFVAPNEGHYQTHLFAAFCPRHLEEKLHKEQISGHMIMADQIIQPYVNRLLSKAYSLVPPAELKNHLLSMEGKGDSMVTVLSQRLVGMLRKKKFMALWREWKGKEVSEIQLDGFLHLYGFYRDIGPSTWYVRRDVSFPYYQVPPGQTQVLTGRALNQSGW